MFLLLGLYILIYLRTPRIPNRTQFEQYKKLRDLDIYTSLRFQEKKFIYIQTISILQ